MKIGELAELSGVAASRIRFYEASGLLQPAQRQTNGYREYSPDALTRLEIILCAQGAGFSLDEIRAILPPDLDKWSHQELLEALHRKISEIELLEQRLAQSKHHLRALVDDITNRAENESCEGRTKRVLDKITQGAAKAPSADLQTRRTKKRA
ncbi:MerR family transcriptional regulator [Ralstonia sp. A12]|uniref:MerR family transcriptional regulator n=1 Tax=Ralstonia sp. A12 TaxID=1217052 RepID=UPI000575BE57|nr:MerR family transcriptional regulator [Ralstonia sp. A12]KHK57922.1 MerR family transcriptional regulator [Ralstonia sp. A12]